MQLSVKSRQDSEEIRAHLLFYPEFSDKPPQTAKCPKSQKKETQITNHIRGSGIRLIRFAILCGITPSDPFRKMAGCWKNDLVVSSICNKQPAIDRLRDKADPQYPFESKCLPVDLIRREDCSRIEIVIQ